jgi:alpha-D-xyloside xylohydrolase
MKFTHGLWGNREHTAIYNSVEVAAVSEPQPGKLKVLCATRHVQNRGNTLNQPTITLNVSAPAPDIISCTATHFRGARSKEPRFELFPGAAQPDYHPEISLNGPAETSIVASHGLHAVLNKSPSAFHLGFHSTETGKSLTGVGYHGIQYIVGPPSQSLPSPLDATTTIADPYYRRPVAQSNRPYMILSLDLQVGELVYGLGERFGPLTKNGQEIDIWNEDAGTCTPYSKSGLPVCRYLLHQLTAGQRIRIFRSTLPIVAMVSSSTIPTFCLWKCRPRDLQRCRYLFKVKNSGGS